MEGSAQDCSLDCLLAEDLSCDQITPVCYGRLGMIPLYPVKTRCKLVSPYSLLSAGKAREMGTKGAPAEIQKPEAVTPKGADLTTLDL